MLNHPTLEKLQTLRLSGMLKALSEQQQMPEIDSLGFEELRLAKADGRYGKLMLSYAKTDLLVLDDWGLTPMTDPQRRDLLELLEDRYGKKSTIVTSQLPVTSWHEAIGDPTLADAILDRIVHNAHKIELKGESMRKNAIMLDQN